MKHQQILMICLFVFALSGCNQGQPDPDLIPVTFFPDNVSNAKLAEELSSYDQTYFAYKIREYKKPKPFGVLYGSYIDPSTGAASIKLILFTDKSREQSNLDGIKRGFGKYIPKLAEVHVSKAPVFELLKPLGAQWIRTLSQKTAAAKRNEGSSLLQKKTTEADWVQLITFFAEINGRPVRVEFEQAHFYEAYEEFPEMVSLYYNVEYDKGDEHLVRLNMHQDEGQWRILGIRMGATYQTGQ